MLPALSSDAPTLSSGCCCEPNSAPGGAILIIFGRDPFVEILCNQKMVVFNSSIQLVILNKAEYS